MRHLRDWRSRGGRGCVSDAHGLDVLIGDPGGADAYWVRVTFELDVRDTGAEVGAGADLVGQRAAVAGAVAEHRVGPLGLIEPHSYPVGEQVPDRQHVLARVLEYPDDAAADRAALGGNGGDRGQRPLAELAVGLVRGVGRNPAESRRWGQLSRETGQASAHGGSAQLRIP
jgi:hypothetical protein